MEQLQEYLKGRRKGDFAKEIGVSGPYLSQIIHGVRRPSFDVMCRIEQATNGAVGLYAWRADAA